MNEASDIAQISIKFSYFETSQESRLFCFYLSNSLFCRFCAEPQVFTFLVQQQTPKSGVPLREIPLVNIKLYKKFTGRCSNDKVWRSRITCFALLETLMGVVFLLISLRERSEDEISPPSNLEDIKWLVDKI